MDMAYALIALFVNSNNRVEQYLYALSATSYNGEHRHSHHLTQHIVVKSRAVALQLVVHIQRNDHSIADVD